MTIDSPLPQDHAQSCAEYRRVLDDVVAEEVDAALLVRAEAHMARCEDCRFRLAQARSYRRMMRRVGQGVRAPSSLRDRAVALIRGPRKPQP
jgi:hypothetical protein